MCGTSKTPDYRDKIAKLLALAESNNENEAKAALLKAKQLMAEHKISEVELKDGKKEVIQRNTEFTCSKRREPWMSLLASVIGLNFCCRIILKRYHGYQTDTIYIVGFEDDVDVCERVFKYAVDCIRSGIKEMKKRLKEYPTDVIRDKINGYGLGYVTGIRCAYLEQQEQDETGWGLVMTVPTEVNDVVRNLNERNYKNSAAYKNASRSSYLEGYEEGRKFSPETKLQGTV